MEEIMKRCKRLGHLILMASILLLFTVSSQSAVMTIDDGLYFQVTNTTAGTFIPNSTDNSDNEIDTVVFQMKHTSGDQAYGYKISAIKFSLAFVTDSVEYVGVAIGEYWSGGFDTPTIQTENGYTKVVIKLTGDQINPSTQFREYAKVALRPKCQRENSDEPLILY
jgi:hypothetical protein